jgi:hypothetical protein
MRHRAHYIVITGESYELYYSHWDALSLPFDMFWGPEHAITHIYNQEKRENDRWLDDVWAEGGALVDPYQKVLLLFGGESLDQDVLLLHTYLQLLKAVWMGWDVRWVDEGILTLADYVGYPRKHLESEPIQPNTEWELSLLPPINKSWVETICSITTENGDIQIYPLDQYSSVYLSHGLELLTKAETQAGLDSLRYSDWSDIFPENGFHIDIPNKVITYWSYFHQNAFHQSFEKDWAGWEIKWKAQNYQAQVQLTKGKLTLPTIDYPALCKQLAEQLMLDSGTDPIQMMQKAIQSMKPEAEQIFINPSALRHYPIELTLEEKQIIFWRACNHLLHSKNR